MAFNVECEVIIEAVNLIRQFKDTEEIQRTQLDIIVKYAREIQRQNIQDIVTLGLDR